VIFNAQMKHTFCHMLSSYSLAHPLISEAIETQPPKPLLCDLSSKQIAILSKEFMKKST
jgi:hypothetical protein